MSDDSIQVVEIPSTAEVLDWPIGQLPVDWGQGIMQSVATDIAGGRVCDLVLCSRDFLRNDLRYSHTTIGVIEGALDSQGLRLGMTAEELEDLRNSQQWVVSAETINATRAARGAS